MRIGVIFPQTEIGDDVGAVRAYGETVAELGFTHILVYDHVVGADLTVHQGWFPYDITSTFHEPFVLFGYLAAVAPIELVTGIIILPQRQTVLVAKQAAEVDLLTGGRFRLGVGLGWNRVEYEALGKSFGDRGRRMDEQIPLLRRLWTEESVTKPGDQESVIAAGLAPLPVQRPIPVWIGAASEPAYHRVGRLADGWFPQMPPGEHLDRALAVIAEAAEAAGRDPATIAMEGRVPWDPADPDRSTQQVQQWREADASHVTINTMGRGLATVDDHLGALTQAANLL